jgi:beta-N-acetylhexosaminidase
MELEHKVGQLLLIGIPGRELDADTKGLLQEVQPGGVLLIGRNIESAQQVHELTSSIRELLQVPPLIAVDQEGGRVDRLEPIYSAMPSADLLRATKDASAAARLGEITAEALRTLGFNVNLAPVLDIAFDDQADNGLRERYFAGTSAEVVRLSGAYLEGLQRAGVVGVGKHFPGLGGAGPDSHQTLPKIDRSRDDLLKNDLIPYAELFGKINARLTAVIISHAHYVAFDGPAPLPASLSKNIATGLLREEMSFKGLTLTDDLTMGAITSTRTIPEAALMAVEAGVDMAMILGSSNDIAAAWRAMVEAARNAQIPAKRISASFDHIARVKSMVSPPHNFTEGAVARLRERIGELNLMLQHSR